jgi:hypothetical protein
VPRKAAADKEPDKVPPNARQEVHLKLNASSRKTDASTKH